MCSNGAITLQENAGLATYKGLLVRGGQATVQPVIDQLMGYVKEGKLRALVALQPTRSSLLPEVPSYLEAALPPRAFWHSSVASRFRLSRSRHSLRPTSCAR